jgi:hypothetical protein
MVLKIFGYIWLAGASLLIIVGIIGVWMKKGFSGVQELLSSYNVVNWLVTVITLAPGLGVLMWANKLEEKKRLRQMKNIVRVVLFSVTLLSSVAQGEESATQKLEATYFATLDGWVNRGGPVNEMQDTVVQTCGKLVMLTATASEKLALTTTQRDEFHFRVDVCTKMTANRVHPQPEFEKKEIVSMVCDESKLSLFRKLCRHSKLR